MRKNTLRLLCSIILTTIAASAQAVSFGVIGGVPLTDPLSFRDESRPYIVGGSIEVRLPARFAVEADVLYQRVGNSTSSFLIATGLSQISAATSFSSRQRGNAWKFPVLGKYYFRPRTSAWQPFVGTGYAFRAIDFRSDVNETIVDSKGASQNHFSQQLWSRPWSRSCFRVRHPIPHRPFRVLPSDPLHALG